MGFVWRRSRLRDHRVLDISSRICCVVRIVLEILGSEDDDTAV